MQLSRAKQLARLFVLMQGAPVIWTFLKNSADLDFVVDYEAIIVKLYLSGGLRNEKFRP
jgi:hypothetical protein